MTTLNLQKTSTVKPKSVDYEIIGGRKNVIRKEKEIFKTSSRVLGLLIPTVSGAAPLLQTAHPGLFLFFPPNCNKIMLT